MGRERIRADAAACILGVERRTVQALAQRGDLPGAAKVGRVWTFHEATLRRFMAGEPEPIAPPPSPQPSPRGGEYEVDPHGSIYVFRVQDFVKIGFSTDWKKRFKHIQTASPYTIEKVFAFAANKSSEARLHKRFAKYHVRGEWFRHDGSVAKWTENEMRLRFP